jgi:hypothetical protein
MDIDFHYYATYVAALLAGYSKDEAVTIAHAGEYVDDSDNSRLLPVEKLAGLTPMVTALPFTQLIAMGRMGDWSASTIAHDRRMWTAFHFLPGNLNYVHAYQGRTNEIAVFDRFEYNDLAREEFRSMCLPDSPLAIAMVNDTVNNHFGNLHLIGIRMHVLIDTFAHMLFCGSAAWHVNDVNAVPEIRFGDRWLPMAIPLFSTQEIYYNSLAYTGHGRMGHIPDYPWITYRYKPQWSAETIVKDNPTQYLRAFQAMVLAMSCIRTGTPYAPPADGQFLEGSSDDRALLEEIERIIRKSEPEDVFLQDYTDKRCKNWIAALPELAKHAATKLPAPPSYDPDAWLKAAELSPSVKDSDYYRFQLAAHEHLHFVRKALDQAGLSLLGSMSFATKQDVGDILNRPMRIKRAGTGKDACYWEIENSSTKEGTPIQLWKTTNNNRAHNTWEIRFIHTSPQGNDSFMIINPGLQRLATVASDRIEAHHDKTQQIPPNFTQYFFIIKRIQADGRATYTFRSGQTDRNIVSEGGYTGNSTKLKVEGSGGDHADWGRWEIEHA